MASIAPGVVIAGRYRLEELLGRGGMGAVWRARHLELDMPVAIKVMAPLHAGLDAWRARFKREAQAAAQLNTPHVARVHDFGVEEDQPYLVMELLEGEDLSARLKREGRLSLAETAHLLGALCKGLRNAHEAGLVHRDLKPANVFLARIDGEEVVKILDFGIAKGLPSARGEQTETGVTLGTPHYMSPEQARDSKRVDPRSDLWSVGVIAFRCLTGRLPFLGDDLSAVVLAVAMDPIPVASEVAPDLGPAADRFFERALARDPAQRFQTADELANALAAMSGSAPLPPRSYAPTAREPAALTPVGPTPSAAAAQTPATAQTPGAAAQTPAAAASTTAALPAWRHQLPTALALLGALMIGLAVVLPSGAPGFVPLFGFSALLLAPAINRPPSDLGRRMLFMMVGLCAMGGVAAGMSDALPSRYATLQGISDMMIPGGFLLVPTLLWPPGSRAARKVRAGILIFTGLLVVGAITRVGKDGAETDPSSTAPSPTAPSPTAPSPTAPSPTAPPPTGPSATAPR